MRLEVSNFAKIGNADLKFDGITVIAGMNNTGKTTIGKILYCIFNSLYDLENQIDTRRNYQIHNLCVRYLQRQMAMSTKAASAKKRGIKTSVYAYNEICGSIAEQICNMHSEDFLLENLMDIILDAFKMNDLIPNKQLEQTVNELYNKLANVVDLDRSKVGNELVFQFFDRNFASQIQSLKFLNEEAKITLTLKGNTISIVFNANSIELEGNIDILHEAYFLDDPFVVDDLRRNYLYLDGIVEALRPRDFLIDKLRISEENIGNVFDTISAKEKISEIMKIVNDVVPGEVSSKGGRWTLSSKYLDQSVDFYNLSAGVKSFVVIKMLLEKGILKEKDMLILDEPEIHLHPEWQLKYAEIIVLLQKMFDLNIVVTTHSRDFFEAINLYSKKYSISDKCSYYLANQSDGTAAFEDVTDDPTPIYRQLIAPNRLLDELRFELEDE